MDSIPLITHIHASPVMAVLVVTGGGSQAIADLLAVPGASRTVLEALVPYSDKSMTEFLGTSPTQAVSIETAAALAQQAYQRACSLRGAEGIPVVGLSCTATLVTDRPKKGAHRAHVGLCTSEGTQVFSLTLQKGARDRIGEERLVSDLLLQVLAVGCGCILGVQLALHPEDQLLIQLIGHKEGNFVMLAQAGIQED
jgi:nicotinamide mononucleotide (NMN) deamidase PncC